MSYQQKPFPEGMKPVEKGRKLAPEYGDGIIYFDVNTGDWEHVCSARFGEPRVAWRDREGKPMTNWTGDSYRYDIFRKDDRIALRWWNGSGEGWLISDDGTRRGESNLLAHIATIEDENLRWDFCHTLWSAAEKSRHAGKRMERKEIETMFLEGRMKKRQKNGEPCVKYEHEILTVQR